MPIINLRRNNLWERFNWSGFDVPNEAFRIYIRAGMAEYRPFAISTAQSQLRTQTIQMLNDSANPLKNNIINIINQTITTRGLEHAAYIFRNGSFSQLIVGTQSHVPDSTAPNGDLLGFIHTHPVPAQLLAPPSSNDFAAGISFERFSVQLVAEMSGRLWQLFDGRVSSYIGFINISDRSFTANSSSASASLVYGVVSGDQLRMEEYEAERQRQREREEEHRRRVLEMRRNPPTTIRN